MEAQAMQNVSDIKRKLPDEIKVIPHSSLENVFMLADCGFGIVYRAKHTDWGIVAYKELKTTIIDQESRQAKELVHEAQMLTLRHANIVALLAITFEPKHYGVVFEYVTFGGLNEFIVKYHVVDRLIKLKIALGIIYGMSYMHSKDPPVIHGDLKIQNILVGDNYVAKIYDFGLAKWSLYSTTKTTSRSRRAAVTHIPPENWRDINTHRSVKFDVYGFGIMLWELFSEQLAFDNVDTGDIQKSVVSGKRPDPGFIEGPEDIRTFVLDWITKCWQDDSTQRPPFSTMIEPFEAFLKGHDQELHSAVHQLNERTSQPDSDMEIGH